MPYIGNTPAEKYVSLAAQHFTVSATTSYTLTHPVTTVSYTHLTLPTKA